MDHLLTSIGYALAYAAVGLLILGLGYAVLDLLTPGRLGKHIYEDKSVNAGIVLASGFVSLGAIVFTTIWTNGESGFGAALIWTVVFGVLGVSMQAVAFVLLDLATPGKMSAMVVERDFHPASVVAAGAMLASSAIVVASIA